MTTRTLYLCYFGLREPLVQTQVLPYLRQLVAAGIEVTLLTFEPQFRRAWTAHELANERARLADEGIRWFHLPYHKRPSLPATIYDILAGGWAAVRLVRRYDIDIIHARAHVPMAMAMLAQWWTKCHLVFDIRGLMAEEYHDAGIWNRRSLPFRSVKALERMGIRKADQVVVLTRRMRDWLIGRKLAGPEKIEVIPCCVDFSRFSMEEKEAVQPGAERFEVVYAGSVTGLYMLEEMGRFFLALRKRRPDAFLRILTVSSPIDATAILERVGLNAQDFWIGAVRPAEVPAYLRRARLGLSFRKPTFSQIAASPTKIPEYLAAGLPVICNAGIGDVDDLLEKEEVGVVVRFFNDDAYAEAASQALVLASTPHLPVRCMCVARQYFDLIGVGGAGYCNVYRRIKEQRAIATAVSQAST